jgi:hypothetical protein
MKNLNTVMKDKLGQFKATKVKAAKEFRPSAPLKNVSGLIKAMEVNPMVNMTFTLNGAITPESTGDKVLDFFSKSGALRNQAETDILKLFGNAFSANEALALRALFYARDVRGGQGERKTFRTCLAYLAKYYPEAVIRNLACVPYFGRFDDLFALFGSNAEEDMMVYVNNCLAADLTSEKPSLLAKWMPSENASSQESREQARKFAKFFGLTPKLYRKMLSYLRGKINIVETFMCQHNWDKINYEHVPSRASLLYKDAFKKHDSARYEAFVADVVAGNKKINASVLFPHEVVNKALTRYDATVEALWKALPNYLEDKPGNRLVVCDVSGSMMNGTVLRPIDVSTSLALYFAERNEGIFKNYFITFSERPELQKIEGDTLHEKLRNLTRSAWGMNTDLQAVFDLVLNKAIKHRVPVEEMPTEIYIISDMQFDECTGNESTNFEGIKNKYNRAKYPMPKIIFWNVNAYVNNGSPVTKDEEGVVLVSGGTPAVVKEVLTGESTTPMDLMLEVLNSERYQIIK